MKKLLVRIALVIVSRLSTWADKEIVKHPDNSELLKVRDGLRAAELGLSAVSLYLSIKK